MIAHRLDGQLELRRERDGVRVTWDVANFPALTLAYAQTSNSAQGRTVDDLLALQTGGSLQQGYVDLSRARQSVTFAHALDDIPGFSALQAYIQRDARRMIVADASRRRWRRRRRPMPSGSRPNARRGSRRSLSRS